MSLSNYSQFDRDHGLRCGYTSEALARGYCKWPYLPANRRSLDPLYTRWCGIKTRCTNPNQRRSKTHLGLPIEPEWVTSFDLFREYVVTLPNRTATATLDRVDNALGYVYGNLRWATPLQQSHNSSRVGRFPGLSYSEGRKTWVCKPQRDGLRITKRFKCPVIALLWMRTNNFL